MVENDQVDQHLTTSHFQVSSDIKANIITLDNSRLDCSLTLTQLLCIHVTNFTFSSFYLLTIDIIYKSVSSSSLESSSSYSFIVITGVVARCCHHEEIRRQLRSPFTNSPRFER